MIVENLIKEKFSQCLQQLYGHSVDPAKIPLQKTNKEFVGDYTINVFPYLKVSGKNPEATAHQIGEWLVLNVEEISQFSVVKGFLNLLIADSFWLINIQNSWTDQKPDNLSDQKERIMIEYPSPNTNKPLHLGHLRNIFLGKSISRLLEEKGNTVIHTCLYNDRGTNISKSMLAWMKWGEGVTPESAGMKGDHLVGDFYVRYSSEYKKELDLLISSGVSEEDAKKQSLLQKQVDELTVKWERGDAQVRDLWSKMNSWVYDGFEQTYKWLGIKPEKYYYESDVYNLGKETVKEGIDKGIFYQKEDGSVWIDLTADGLDHKLVLRSNSTTVYITQDIAVAYQKEKDFSLDRSIYLTGNEQDYHFKVLFLILKKLGFPYADKLYHLSYGMVELPEGKMKSREGTVVDADDLIAEMISTARSTTEELGKIDGFTDEEAQDLYRMLALGALKYFILKVDPKKKMIFNPKESIDFNGNTGPFIQYTHARIKSVLRKAGNIPGSFEPMQLNEKERELLKLVYSYVGAVNEAALTYSPSVMANYVYELAKTYNQFYHDHQILKEENQDIRDFRIILSDKVAKVIAASMNNLGIEVPERM